MKLMTMRSGAVRQYVILAVALLMSMGEPVAVRAAVTAAGDVSPAPPAVGGNVAGPFQVGNVSVGTLSISAATPLTVTGGNMIVGGTATTGFGIVQLSGIGSNLVISATTADLVIGNDGNGSVSAAGLARITTGDDLNLAVAATATGKLFVDGFGTTVDVADTLLVAGLGAGLLQITAGGRLDADDSIIGQGAGSDGRVTVSGNGSTLDQSEPMILGEAGRGELQVLAQGLVQTTNVTVGNAATGAGVAVVSGAGSTWKITGFLNHGVAGTATLNVLDGGLLTTTGALRMATTVTSESHVVVSGVNALLNVGTTVTVGEAGFATLDVRNSAHLNSTNVVIADNVGSRGEVLVEGVGSTWKINGTLDVSEPGEAQLAITGGGQVTASGVVRIGAAGRLLMGTGRLEAGGAGLTNNGIIQGSGRITGNVANAATGKIRLSPGNSMILANDLTNAGLVDLDSSELETLGALANNADIDARSATLRTGGAGFVNNSGAQFAITEGTVDVYGAVNNLLGAQIVVGGQATGVFHDALTNNGQFFVFPDAHVLALENLTFTPSAALNLQIGLVEEQAAAATVESAGQAALAGALAVTLAPGFAPALGDAFQVLTAAGGVSGTFGSTSLPLLGGGLMWDVDYDPTNVTLSVIAGLMADFEADGDVDAADLSKWKTGFAKTGTVVKADGDADGDGDVDGVDFLAWQSEFGVVLGAAANEGAVGAVPEPASWTLLAVGMAWASSIRARRSRRGCI